MNKLALGAVTALAALALAGCGKSETTSEDAAADTVEMPAEEAMSDATGVPLDTPDADATGDAAAAPSSNAAM